MNLSLRKMNFLNIIIITLILTVSIGFIEFYKANANLKKQIKRIEVRYLKERKSLSKSQVEKAVNRINYDIDLKYNYIKNKLDNKTEDLANLYKFVNEEYPDKKNGELFKHYITHMANYKSKSYSEYSFIFDKNKKLIYHEDNELLVGRKIDSFKNVNELVNLSNSAISYGSSLGKYSWINPKTDKKENKYIAIKHIENTDYYIATCYNLEKIKKEIKKNIGLVIDETRFGLERTGYYWLYSLNGKMINHPIEPSLNQTLFINFKNSNDKYPFREISKLIKENNSGFIEYLWKHPHGDLKEERKISYIKKINHFDFVLGSGFYFRELNSIIEIEKKILEKQRKEDLMQIFFFLSLILFIAILIAIRMNKGIKKIEDDKTHHLNMLEQYNLILDKSSIVSKFDLDGNYIYVNKKFEETSGYSSNELIGKSYKLLKDISMPKEMIDSLWKDITAGKIWSGIVKNRKKDSSSYFANTTILPIKDIKGKVTSFISSSSNITDLIDNKDLLKQFTLTDGLTGLGSRIKLINDIQNSDNNTLALIDMSKFTLINDLYGHKIGDSIIKMVANKIYECTKNQNISTYRLHSDVFAILCNQNKLEKFSEHIKGLVSKLKELNYKKDDINISLDFVVGIAKGDKNVLAYADLALKNAKENHIFIGVYNNDNTLLEEYKNNEKWMKIVSDALADDRIVPYFQQIYSYKNPKKIKYEALMRLIDSNGNVISPFNFLDIVKNTKIYPKLTQTMIRKSIDKFRNHLDISFSINLTLEDLVNEETMQYLYSNISVANMFENLIIEIVESDELIGFENVGKTLERFKEKGSKIAIDDFGTGYSNYNYLRKLDADFIKIDGSIIKNVEDTQTKEVIKTILDFAKKSNMKTVAEFVCGEEIYDMVEELGVDFAQGYYVGRPEPLSEL